MGKKNRFIDPDVFKEYVALVQKRDGAPYDQEAIDGMHSDLSRFVVGVLAAHEPEQLRKLYTETGWSDNMWADALHGAAREWMKVNGPKAQR